MTDKNILGYRGIFNRYTVKRNLRSWVSILIAVQSVCVSVWLFFFKDFEQILNLLNKIIDVLLGSLPDLLGFCIGGYAILVAMNNLEKMPAVLRKQEKSDLSYYINISADFAMTLLIMSALLLCSFILRLIVDLDLTAINDTVGKIINLMVISLLLWAGIVAIFMVMGTVANIFSTSIILHDVARLANEEDKSKENGNDKEETYAEVKTYEVKSWFGTYTVNKMIKKETK